VQEILDLRQEHDILREDRTLGESTMKLTKTSTFSGEQHTYTLNCSEREFDSREAAWQGGAWIHHAFPSPRFSADDREFIMSGIIPAEWVAYMAALDAEFDSDGDILDQ